jgi:ABC-type sugar transport system substrate-binding protein
MQRSIKSRTVALALAAVTISTVVLSGCSATVSPASSKSASAFKCGTIGFVPLNQTQDIFTSQAKTAQTWAAQHGCKLLVGDAKNDPLTQANIIDGWVAGKQVSAILVAPVDINALKPSLTEAAKAKIPTLINGGLDKPFAADEAVVVTDWVDYGKKAGTALAACVNKKFGGKGVVAILGGPTLPGTIVTGRINAEISAIKKLAPHSNVVANQNGQGQTLPSQDAMAALLLKYPTINAVTGTNDDSMVGVVNAVKAAGKDPSKLCIVGLDATAPGLAAVQSGDFYATVDLQPNKLVTDGLSVLTDMIQHKKPALAPGYIMVDNTRIVTK